MSTVNIPTILKVVGASVCVANRAGRIIREIMSKGDLGIVQKTGANDLQTAADRAAESCIVKSLSTLFPKATIIGEEGDDGLKEIPSDWISKDVDLDVITKPCPEDLKSIKEEQVVIWVDPLDGTSEYTQGLLDHVTVLIGVAVDGKSVGGVIHQPYYNYQDKSLPLGRTIWGIPKIGYGGFKPQEPPANKRIVTTTRSHSNVVVQKALDALKPDDILRVGGAGHKVLLLMEGKAHAYVFASKGCKKWDTCAPQAVLESVGGKLTDIQGDYYPYHSSAPWPNTGGVLATYKTELHDWYIKTIPEEVRQTMTASC